MIRPGEVELHVKGQGTLFGVKFKRLVGCGGGGWWDGG